ncbi:SDR family NAD(P)-dependent oxidoreductase [Thermogemmatispora onikobensis]|uniref:SDR family NAD(P)-dependent oxidoreductase n=1 Tax=Thermogemmatispora onikobensis TaxID=732234 RepID=UPI000853356E|nr:SDR family oxidoreductase [Thermogemmatispora onikobensis]
MSIKDRVAVITGAGRGIGRATAERFAREGANLVLFSRTPEHLDETRTRIERQGGRSRVLAIAGDVAREEDVERLFQQARAHYGRVDILINSAGIVALCPFREMDTATWDRVLAVNLRGTFLCCRAAFRLMAEQGQGVIINLSSLSGVKGVEKFPGLSAYNVSKAGVASLTEILALEGKAHNIRVCAVSPGAVDTDMLRQAAPHLKPGMSAEDMAEILLFLADDSGRRLSGTNLEIYSNA